MFGRAVPESSHRHCYNVDGLVSIGTSVRLPELEFFRVPHVAEPDIIVRTRPVGGISPRSRVSITRRSSVVEYREHLGGMFANFSVDMSHPIVVTVGPLLAVSPHVIYTNVVEPMLRFVLASKGKMLLHAACISVGGKQIMLSAKTDTGKTSTILTMLRRDGGIFYSDDMVIIDATGMASRYPKPLTISAHTLRAVPQHRLSRRQKMSLPWQSRLHSRGGRAAGKMLGASNLPIMSMNAIVQALIPPPKYHVTELVTCNIGTQVKMENIYVIERGSPILVEPVSPADAILELLENTEDAYGFPPYRSLAPHLSVRGEDHAQLCERERAILAAALSTVEVIRIRVPDYGWPALINSNLTDLVPAANSAGPTPVPASVGGLVGAAHGAS